ncbi:scavenger receptor cysteine-rich domain superfamily protein-like [Anneissia japonica]|uniref:scavenger receptor cysteine-rich domain superfamily protein-like n=1 Tax=Anneissia japonica TaxID=1529436 RepID=UPI0014258166|nr:scavenger receptor cysteine-rich domain superfamily protein-like [Anneissia japonica]
MAHCLQRLVLVSVYVLLHSNSSYEQGSWCYYYCVGYYGYCIPESWLCDGENDCYDNSDEADNLCLWRLVGGAVEREGRVELHGSIVGTVCSIGWTEQDADLLCKSLGYEGVKEHLVYTFGEGTGDIWSNFSGCIEDFSSPSCNPVNTTNDSMCTHSEDVGIVCSPMSIRLVGKESHEGRVEIFYFDQWSTVHGLSLHEAHLICHQLGYPAAELSDCCGIFGTSFEMPSYEINCISDEQEIAECSIIRTYSEEKQSGVTCARGVRLINGEFDSEGLLEIYTESEWHKVCTPDINIDAARVICKQLNFHDVFNIRDVSSRNSNSSTIINIICSGSESKFEECAFEIMPNKMCKNNVYLLCETSGSRFVDGYSRISGFAQTYFNNTWTYICDTTEDVLQSVCLEQQSTGIRLIRLTLLDDKVHECINCNIHNGLLQCHYIDLPYYYNYTECSTDTLRIREGSHQGLVEIFKNDSWISVCQDHWNLQAAEIACRELHFLGVSESPTQPDPYATWTPDAAVVQCSGSETSLSHCQFDHSVQCSTHAVQLTCLDVGVRFEESAVDFAGRVEIYTNNEWGTVCDDFWDNADANVACIMAGYIGAIASYRKASFGEGVGSILANDFHCNGEETSLFDCSNSVHDYGYCHHHEDAGVVCSTDVIRLSDGSASAGRVEVFINGLWGTVCDDNWDLDDAFVACRQLGFDDASAVYVNGRFGAGEGPIHLDEVQCTGEETELSQCRSIKIHDCQHSEDAGISCISDSGVTPAWLNSFSNVQTEGCYDYWFRSDRSCLTVIRSDNVYTNFTDISPCPHGSTFLTMDTSLETLTEYLTILYSYEEEEEVFNVFLWKVESQCTYMNRDDEDIWGEFKVACNSLHVNAYVCQMNIQEQSHSCSNNQFKCLSGTCILKSLVCDGNYDCPDKSDEEEQCIQECFKMEDGSDYRGTHNATEDGTICLPWTSPFKGTDSIYPADFIGKGIGDHNYCRNPDGESRPWCYSSDFYEVIDYKIPRCCKFITLH